MINVVSTDECCMQHLEPFEDEIDCAILCPGQFNSTLEVLQHLDPRGECYDEEEVVDTTINYDNVVPEADMVDVDADDVIAAERDIAYNANEDDELIDIATNYDDGINTIELTDEDL